MSFTVIRPAREPSLSTTNSFSIRCSCSISFALSRVVPTGTVTKLSVVMRSLTLRSKFVSKRISLLVIMPINFPSLTTGNPLI